MPPRETQAEDCRTTAPTEMARQELVEPRAQSRQRGKVICELRLGEVDEADAPHEHLRFGQAVLAHRLLELWHGRHMPSEQGAKTVLGGDRPVEVHHEEY